MGKTILTLALCCVALGGAALATSCKRGARNNELDKQSSSERKPVELLVAAPGEAEPVLNLSAEVAFSRVVSVDLDTVRNLPRESAVAGRAATSISFRLKEDLAVTGMVQQFEQNAAGSAIWTGTVQNSPGSFFALVERNGNIAAHMSAPEGDFYILPTSEGSFYRVDQPHLSNQDATACQVKIPHKTGRTAIAPAASPTAFRDDGKRIDILVVYTEAAEKHYGSADKLKVVVDLAEKETNMALKQSLVDLEVKVVNIVKLLSFKETLSTAEGTSDKDLDRLAKEADGKEARDLRDKNRADQVTLLRAQGDAEGTAYVLVSPLIPKQDQAEAFSSVRVNNVVYKYNFTHELGHNLGCHHNVPKTGLYRFSRGYCFDLSDGKTYGTIMSYCGANRRILHYSNPGVTYPNQSSGKPTGEPELLSNGKQNPTAADCARTITDAKLQVANYRQSGT